MNKEHCYNVLDIPAEKIFNVEDVNVELPSYSRILGSLVCSSCGEKFMETKAVKKGDKYLCPYCGGEYGLLDWAGIHFVKKEIESTYSEVEKYDVDESE